MPKVSDKHLKNLAKCGDDLHVIQDMARELLAARAVVRAGRDWYCECQREIAVNEEGQQGERISECDMCKAIRNYD